MRVQGSQGERRGQLKLALPIAHVQKQKVKKDAARMFGSSKGMIDITSIRSSGGGERGGVSR